MNVTEIPAAEPVTATPSQRQDILDVARYLTLDRTSPEAVTAAASPLLAWVEKARDKADVFTRVHALRQQRRNYGASAYRVLPAAEDENPGSFLASAQVLYAFADAETKAG